MILAAARQQQCKVLDLGIARDDEEDINRILESAFAAEIDILITSGGVSMGDRDFVKPLLERKGRVHFHKVHFWLSFRFVSHSFFSFTDCYFVSFLFGEGDFILVHLKYLSWILALFLFFFSGLFTSVSNGRYRT